jgi:hypothetical protein
MEQTAWKGSFPDWSVHAAARRTPPAPVRRVDTECRIERQAGLPDIIGYADGEAVARLGLRQLVKYQLRRRRAEILRRQPVTSAHHQRQRRPLATCHGSGECRHDVEIERLARGRRAPWFAPSSTATARTACGNAARKAVEANGRYSRTCSTPTFCPCARSTAAVPRAVSAPEPINTIALPGSAAPSAAGDSQHCGYPAARMLAIACGYEDAEYRRARACWVHWFHPRAQEYLDSWLAYSCWDPDCAASSSYHACR